MRSISSMKGNESTITYELYCENHQNSEASFSKANLHEGVEASFPFFSLKVHLAITDAVLRERKKQEVFVKTEH